MYDHHKRALRLVRKKLAERGIEKSPEDQLEIVMMALLRESFWYSLEACVEWAVEVSTGPRSTAA